MFLCVHQAEPVLSDIQEVCKAVDQQMPEEPAEEPTQVRENFVLAVGASGLLLFPQSVRFSLYS